jgi:hypothetical protein
MFDSCCRADISGEDLSRNSIDLCKEAVTGAAEAAIEQTRTSYRGSTAAHRTGTRPEAAQGCCRIDMSRGSTVFCITDTSSDSTGCWTTHVQRQHKAAAE